MSGLFCSGFHGERVALNDVRRRKSEKTKGRRRIYSEILTWTSSQKNITFCISCKMETQQKHLFPFLFLQQGWCIFEHGLLLLPTLSRLMWPPEIHSDNECGNTLPYYPPLSSFVTDYMDKQGWLHNHTLGS